MKDWQKNRNYKKRKNADGTYTYIITIDGTDVEVTKEVFAAYSKADRRERYCAERDAEWILSLERMKEDDVLQSYFTKQLIESAEDIVIKKSLIERVSKVFAMLSAEEQHLIQALVVKNMSEYEYAKILKVNQSTVHRRKAKILDKLFRFIAH